MEKPVHLPKLMIVAIASNAATCLLYAHQDELLRLETYQEKSTQSYKIEDEHSIREVHYKRSKRHDEQFEQHNAKMNVYKNLNVDWKEDFTMRDEYSAYWHKIIRMLTQFKTNLDGHLCSIKAVEHQKELYKT